MSDDKRPEAFLQWKNTSACLDFYCTCGEQFHYDGYFAGEPTCGHCGQTYELPHMLAAKAVEPTQRMKIVFDARAVLGDGQFTFTWPRSSFDVKPGELIEIYDEPVEGCQRGAYANLMRTAPQDDGTTLVTAFNTGQVP